MPTVVDSLIVTLGLDASNFTKGQKEAADALIKTRQQSARTAKEMSADGSTAAEYFTKVKTEALSLIGILVGTTGLKSFIRSTTKSLADLGRESRSIGESAGQVDAFAMAIQRMGGSASGAVSALQAFASAQANARQFGDPQFALEMGLIGGNLDTKPLEAMQLFERYIEKYKNAPGGIQNIESVASKLFPGMDRGTLQALEQMGSVAELNRQVGISNQLGTPTPDMIKNATAFQAALAGIGQAAEHDGEMLLNKMFPALTSVTNAMTAYISQNPAALAGLSAMAGWLTVMAGLNFKSLLGFFAAATKFAPFLLLTGPAGGEDKDFSEQKNQEYLKDHPPETRHPVESWLRDFVDNLKPGPFKRLMQEKFGTNAISDTSMDPQQQAFLKTLSDPESGGAYDVKNGGSTFSDFSKFPQGIGPGGTSTASGRYQFTASTWADVSGQLGLKDFSPASQDKAAWYLASQEYRKKTGRDLAADLKSGGHQADIASTLNGRWPSLPGGSQSRQTLADFSGRLQSNLNAPLPVPPVPPPAGAGASNSGAPVPSQNITNIGSITVTTAATDPAGIARGIGGALINQGNRGAQ